MKHIILYGHLAKKFGRHHYFDVRTPGEAVRALSANFPGFKGHVLQHNEPGYHVRVGKEYRDEEGLGWPVDGSIKIIPAVTGSGSIGKIILGAALVFFAPYAAGFLATSGAWAAAAVAFQVMPAVGYALALGGVSQLLFSPPPMQGGANEPVDSKPGYAFDGPVNTTVQGNAVPVCYGRVLVGSQVVSAGIEAQDIQ